MESNKSDDFNIISVSLKSSQSNYSAHITKQANNYYNYLRIPPDWSLAKIHALSRETKPEINT